MAKEDIIAQFTGLDYDTVLEFVGKPSMGSFQGAIVDAEHIHIYPGSGGNGMAIRKLGGTEEIVWNPPAGINTGHGSFWDQTGNTVMFFMLNSLGDHSIVWHKPDAGTTSTITIPAMNLSDGHPVTGCVFVNQKYLIFTDGGDYPKFIDLPKADSLNKKSIVRLYLPVPAQGVVVQSRTLNIAITLNGAVQGGFHQLASPSAQQIWDLGPMFQSFALQFNLNTSLNSQFTASACAEYLEFESLTVGMWSLGAFIVDTIGGVIQPQASCVAEYVNRYNAPFTFEQITLSTVMPRLSPSAVMAYDDAKKSSLIENKVFQFQYAFRMVDKRRTLTSAISDIGLPVVSQCQNAGGQYNCIDIGFNDPWLADPAIRGEVEFIDLFMRAGNTGSWYKIQQLDKWEWMFNRTFRFYNNGTFTPSDQAYNNAGNTFLPPIANAMCDISTIDNQMVLALGGTKEGDDTPCLDVVLSPRIDGSVGVSGGTASVTGKIYIISGFDNSLLLDYRENQCIQVYDENIGPTFGGMAGAGIIDTHTGNPENWKQTIPMGGWIPYLAGTDNYTISKQTYPTAFVSGGSVQPTLWSAPVGSSAANRNVYDATQTGYSVQPANRTHRSAMRECIELRACYSTFTLTGLVPGQTYVLRLASHKCFRGPGTDIYDLNNTSLDWQKTSTRVAKCGSVTSTSVKPGRFECTITVPLNGAGTTIDIGDIQVCDFTNPNLIAGSFGIESYFFDADGTNYSPSYDIRKQGVPAEKQMLAFRTYNTVSGIAGGIPASLADTPNTRLNAELRNGQVFSDHNGFAYFWDSNLPFFAPKAGWVTVGGIANNAGAITGFAPTTIFVTDFTILNNVNDDKWEGDLSLPVMVTHYNGFLPTPAGSTELIIPMLVGTAVHRRTNLTARFLTLAGSPIMGIAAIMENGRVKSSDAGGYIGGGSQKFYVYADVPANQNNRDTNSPVNGDHLVFINGGPCNIQFTGGNLRDVLITQFIAGNQWSETVPYDLGDIFGVIVGVGRGRGYHRGGSYSIGYHLGRWNGDRTPEKQVLTVRFPGLNEYLDRWLPLTYTAPNTVSDGIGVIDWVINGAVPPLWIGEVDFIQLGMTWDNSSTYMVQWLASQVLYSSIWDEATTEPTVVQYGTGTATEIYIALTDSFVRYGELHSDARGTFGTTETGAGVGYLWKHGDMLRILTDQFGQPLFDGSNIEVPITGQRGRYITISASSSIPELFGGEVIEVFTPRKGTESEAATFFDIPGARILVNHANNTWVQTSGTLDKGDTWILPRKVPIDPDTLNIVSSSPWVNRTGRFASKWMNDFAPTTDWARGKPWFQDADAKTEDRPTLMRYTEPFVPSTNINQLNFAGGFNVRLADNWLGKIMKMVVFADQVIVILTNGSVSIYKATQQLKESAESLVEISGGILANLRPFVHKYGTQNPLAVESTETSLFFWDGLHAALVQWASNALQDMGEQKNCRSYLMRKSDGLIKVIESPCMGFDAVNGEFILSFPSVAYTTFDDDGLPVSTIDNPESITYHDKQNHFICRHRFKPDCWGKSRLAFYSVYGGRILRHEARFGAGEMNKVDGVQMESTVTVPFVDSPLEIKTDNTLWLARGSGWDVPSIKTNAGHFTSMDAVDFDTMEGGISKAAVPSRALIDNPSFDVKKGDYIAATAYVFKLRHLGTNPCYLLWAKFGKTPSPDTGKNSAGQ